MDLFAALVALGRRWYLTIALLIVLLAGTYVAASATKPEYKAEATVIVLAPSQDATKAANLGTSNPVPERRTRRCSRTCSSRVMASDTTTQQIVKSGGTSNYTVGQGTSTNGPIVLIEATSASPTVATRHGRADHLGDQPRSSRAPAEGEGRAEQLHHHADGHRG